MDILMSQLLQNCPIYASNYAPITIEEENFTDVKKILQSMKQYMIVNKLQYSEPRDLIDSAIKDPNYTVFWYDDLNEWVQRYYILPKYLDSLGKSKVTIKFGDLPKDVRDVWEEFFPYDQTEDSDEEDGVLNMQCDITSKWAFSYCDFSDMPDLSINFYRR